MANWKQDFVLSLVLGLIAIAFYAVAQNYPHDAALFPTHLAPLLLALAVWLGIGALQRRGTGGENIRLAHYKPVIFVVVLLVGYAAVLNYVGYIAASIALVAASLLGIGYTRRKTALSVAVGSALVVYGLFGVLLEVPLPLPYFMQ